MILPPLRDTHVNYRHRRKLHVLRFLLALCVTFTIIERFAIQHNGWALVTTIMVMGNLPPIERRMLSSIELLLATHWTSGGGHQRIDAMTGLRDEQHTLAPGVGTAESGDGRMLFSPDGYLWLNRELARLTVDLSHHLGGLERLPSRRLRRRAPLILPRPVR